MDSTSIIWVKFGNRCFQGQKQETLQTLNAELSDKKLVFIDMSSAKLKNDLDDLMTIVPASLVHVVCRQMPQLHLRKDGVTT